MATSREGARRRRLRSEDLLDERSGEREFDAGEARRRRVERLESSEEESDVEEDEKMDEESSAPRESLRSETDHRRRERRSGEERRHHRHHRSDARDDEEFVYERRPERQRSPRNTAMDERRVETTDEEDHVRRREPVREKRRKEKKIRIVYVTKEEMNSGRYEERRPRMKRETTDRPKTPAESIRRSRGHASRRQSFPEATTPSPQKRSNRHLPSDTRPSLERSNTTTSHAPTANTSSRRASFFGGFLRPIPQPPREPERLVECLTCLSDDIPRSKSAKMKCGHRMCHSCLKRIFRLSVTDPQHMPPKCCTADHIPLKHVERLFDTKFKMLWNRKFQEFSTKNRIYCPARRCGEWIKPGNMHKEDGRKYGKCGRCKTKVCCLCNGKWHGTKDCPKDEETNRLLAAAKEAGWQRCYNCRTMVELKEGCNHMTCRCTAEFCMICGLKWKSCNCPWFNYEAVEADRLNHMQNPEEGLREPEPEPEPERPRRPRRPRLNTYHDEMQDRRRQERVDEDLARRLQRTAIVDDDDDDYRGDIGEIHGVGNNADHFMNQDYIRAAQNILTGNFDQANVAANYVMGLREARGTPPRPRREERYQAPPRAPRPPSPPPMLRRHTMREVAYNNAERTRPAERVVPRRSRTDYAAEAAVHAPVGRAPHRSSSRREPTPAVLAGLTGRVRGNRVSLWRSHIEVGIVPEEGVLSHLDLGSHE